MFIHPDHPSEPRFVGPRGLFLSSGIKQTARPECTAYALTVCREIKQGTGDGGTLEDRSSQGAHSHVKW